MLSLEIDYILLTDQSFPEQEPEICANISTFPPQLQTAKRARKKELKAPIKAEPDHFLGRVPGESPLCPCPEVSHCKTYRDNNLEDILALSKHFVYII